MDKNSSDVFIEEYKRALKSKPTFSNEMIEEIEKEISRIEDDAKKFYKLKEKLEK